MNVNICPVRITRKVRYGFTGYKTIQDFPIRGRSVYLHVRRRKWIDRSTGEIFTYEYDNLTEFGSKTHP